MFERHEQLLIWVFDLQRIASRCRLRTWHLTCYGHPVSCDHQTPQYCWMSENIGYRCKRLLCRVGNHSLYLCMVQGSMPIASTWNFQTAWVLRHLIHISNFRYSVYTYLGVIHLWHPEKMTNYITPHPQPSAKMNNRSIV